MILENTEGTLSLLDVTNGIYQYQFLFNIQTLQQVLNIDWIDGL